MRRWAIIATAALGAAACDLPTDAPRWEQTWVVPAEVTRISVADFLPSGVTLAPDGAAFRVTTSPVHLSASLAEMCEACAPLDGAVVAKPAFTAVLTATTTLPEDLLAASSVGGNLDVAMAHSFTFDPLRPAGEAGEAGHVVVAVTGDGQVLARDSISGRDHPFPAGSVLAPTLPVRPATVANELELGVRLFSPAGDPVLLRMSDTLGVVMAASVVDLAEVTIRATGIEFAPATTPLEFDMDSTTLTRLRSAALRFDVRNPFDLEGTLRVRFELGTRVIERTVELRPGQSSGRVEFSGDEIRAIMSAPDGDLVVSGHVSAASGRVTLRPDQELVLDTAFELVVLVGGREET